MPDKSCLHYNAAIFSFAQTFMQTFIRSRPCNNLYSAMHISSVIY